MSLLSSPCAATRIRIGNLDIPCVAAEGQFVAAVRRTLRSYAELLSLAREVARIQHSVALFQPIFR